MLYENILLHQAQALAGLAAADMTARAGRVRDLRRMAGLHFRGTTRPWHGMTNHSLSHRFASQSDAIHLGIQLHGQALAMLSPDDEPEYARRNFRRRYRRFQQLLDMCMRRFRFHAERDAWRAHAGEMRLSAADATTQQAEQRERSAWRLLLAQAAGEVLHEHDRPVGHGDRADTGGASADQLRLLRICAETGGAADIRSTDIQQMARCAVSNF